MKMYIALNTIGHIEIGYIRKAPPRVKTYTCINSPMYDVCMQKFNFT